MLLVRANLFNWTCGRTNIHEMSVVAAARHFQTASSASSAFFYLHMYGSVNATRQRHWPLQDKI